MRMYEELLQLLLDLEGVQQDSRYHPEGCALFHSLQVFDAACAETDDGELIMAALLHDVGKAVDSATHAELGAELIEGLVPERVAWLVRHHLDLLRAPKKTRARFRNTNALKDLEALRRFDLAGRRTKACVCTPEDALAYALNMMNPHPHDAATDAGGNR